MYPQNTLSALKYGQEKTSCGSGPAEGCVISVFNYDCSMAMGVLRAITNYFRISCPAHVTFTHSVTASPKADLQKPFDKA
jgi:hypothetical protein